MKGHFIFVVLICGAGGSTFKDLFSQGRAGKTQQRKAPATNLLMIMFDDLRPELSIYGRDYMITPNFERLANRSIIFDNAFCQVAVCNPSRDSLLTGLRPDNVGTYGFGHSFRPHQTINSLLVGAGYNTAGVGKIVHWDEPDHAQWSFSQWHDDWYGYQNAEWNWMNSSTMPDKVRPEEEFRDYKYASRAISDLRALSSSQKRTGKNFMLGLGFKLPHLCMHIPFKYFDLYRNRTDRFSLSKREATFPANAASAGFRVGESNFRLMNGEGAKKSQAHYSFGRIDGSCTARARKEAMWGYAASISFVDAQLGRVLDEMDRLGLWKSTTVVLTADHGMHNGEKNMWEKWTVFDEATHVPLLIAHPESANAGRHYAPVVESIDIAPSILELVNPKWNKAAWCASKLCKPFDGKSLANVVLRSHTEDGRVGKFSSLSMRRNHLARVMGVGSKKLGETEVNMLREVLKDDNRSSSSRGSSGAEQERNDLSGTKEKGFHISLPRTTRGQFGAALSAALGESILMRNTSTILSSKFSNPWRDSGVDMARDGAENGSRDKLLSFLYDYSSLPALPEDRIMGSSFAISQSYKCAPKVMLLNEYRARADSQRRSFASYWEDCDESARSRINLKTTVAVMGYSVRTLDFRYTAWLHFNPVAKVPLLDVPPLEEDLFDHRGDLPAAIDLGHRELVNLARHPGYTFVVSAFRTRLLRYIRERILSEKKLNFLASSK